MNENISKVMQELHSLCHRSIKDGDFNYYHNQELEKYCGLLEKNPDKDLWIPPLLELAEEFDEAVDLTLGAPGPIVWLLLEQRPILDKHLQNSLNRKPTVISAWLASECAALSKSDKEKNQWAQRVRDVLAHPNATSNAIDFAKEDLR